MSRISTAAGLPAPEASAFLADRAEAVILRCGEGGR